MVAVFLSGGEGVFFPGGGGFLAAGAAMDSAALPSSSASSSALDVGALRRPRVSAGW
jgi:hypothetical protein